LPACLPALIRNEDMLLKDQGKSSYTPSELQELQKLSAREAPKEKDEYLVDEKFSKPSGLSFLILSLDIGCSNL